MHHKNPMLRQRLIVELDDTAKLYSTMVGALVSLYAKSVVERIVLAHEAIAADLVEHMRTMGVQKVRRGSMLGKLRAYHAYYAARRPTTGADFDVQCLLQIENRTAQIAQHFAEAADHAAGLKQRMRRHLGALEDVSAPVTLMLNHADLPLGCGRPARFGTTQSYSYAGATASMSSATSGGPRGFHPVAGTHRFARARSLSRALDPVRGYRDESDRAHSGSVHARADLETIPQPAVASMELP